MLVNDIVKETCVEHRVIDWRKTFLESPLKAQTAANDPRAPACRDEALLRALSGLSRKVFLQSMT